MRRLIIRIILSTDMAKHHDSVEDFTASLRLWGPDLAAWAPDKRVVALQVRRRTPPPAPPLRPSTAACCCPRAAQRLPQPRRHAASCCQCRRLPQPAHGCLPTTTRHAPHAYTYAPAASSAPQLLVHAADISNPARPLRFSSQWGRKVHEEFFAQGEPLRDAAGRRPADPRLPSLLLCCTTLGNCLGC